MRSNASSATLGTASASPPDQPMPPIAIAQVVGCMRRAGIETWLMNVARRLDPRRFALTFCVHAEQEADYDRELLDLGCRLVRIGCSKHSFAYPAALAHCLRNAGPFEVLHSHEHQISGVILAVARRLGIPSRIAHSHNDTSCHDRLPNLPRFTYRAVMRGLIRRHATHGLACSELAAPSLFGTSWRRDPRFHLLPYGFDFDRFAGVRLNPTLRSELGIPPDRWVIGHVGRMETQKNHGFLIEIAAHLRVLDPRCHFLFVGDGTLRTAVELAIASHGLADCTTILSSRPDVPEILTNAVDCFLFPSLHEGLPLALIEAQAAALPCILSSNISPEANLFPDSNLVLPLDRSPKEWAARILQMRCQPVGVNPIQRVARLKCTPLAIEESVRRLESLYGVPHAAVH
ncbi:glycosyltransferase [Paludibaculum fermentans]|uniref:glycosyltransferase n=1 Tax=Paludibaculum fermentans TaxID=1473598 RepID=UPI003EC076A0